MSKLHHYWVILKKSWRLEETCCHSNSSERPSANVDVKKHSGSKIIISGKKKLYGRFNRLISYISHEKTKTWLRKWKTLKREREPLLIAAQKIVIRTNHIKAKIDKMQQNSKCWLCNCDWCIAAVTKELLKGLEDLEIRGRVEII